MPQFRREGRAGFMQGRKLLEYAVFEQVCEFPEIGGNVPGYDAHDSSIGEGGCASKDTSAAAESMGMNNRRRSR